MSDQEFISACSLWTIKWRATQQRRLAWRSYAAAALSSGCDTDAAATLADRLTAEEVKRFGPMDGEL